MSSFPTIPNYRIVRKLGEGGMAYVYMGIQEKLDRTVAIKVLKSHHLKDENFAKRFLKEAETAANLIHPNIVTIYDVGEADGLFYIVMELLDSSLKDNIKQMIFNGSNYKVSLENGETMIEPMSSVFDNKQGTDGSFYGFIEASNIIKDIGSALDYAHKEGFIHRDIKPDNILFRKDKTPVLVDFGIARPINSSSGMTTEGILIGTPHYMSPEQCLGESIDKRSDFYSLGVVYYELLTGKVPYKADSATGVLVKHIKSPVPVLPKKLEIIQPFINRMMSKNKNKRISNNEELLDVMNPLQKKFELSGNNDNAVDKKNLNDDWIFNDNDVETDTNSYNIIDKEELEGDVSTSSLKLFFMVAFLAIFVVAYFIFVYKSSNDSSKNTFGNIAKNEIIKTSSKLEKKKEADRLLKDKLKAEEKEKTDQVNRYLVIAEEYLAKNNFDMALEKTNLAKKILNSKKIQDLENKIKNQKEEEIKKKRLENYKFLVDTAKEDLAQKKYKKAYENLRSAALIMETDEVKELVDRVIKEEKIAIEKKKEIERREKAKIKRDKRAYKKAKSINKLYGYETYLKNFPKGKYRKEAKRRLDDLKSAIILEETGKDNNAFEKAKTAGTISSYEKYIKKNRAGKFISVAQKEIEKLKERIRKTTKIKFNIDYIRFFNRKTGKPGKYVRRNYSKSFTNADTNYIFTETRLLNKFYKIDDFTARIFIEYKNINTKFIYKTKEKKIQQKKDLSSFIYTTGMGWKDKGKWKPGKYTVSIYMDGKLIGKNNFIVK